MKYGVRVLAVLLCLLTAAAPLMLSSCSVLGRIADGVSDDAEQGSEEGSAEEATEAVKGFAPGEYDEYYRVNANAYRSSPYYEPVKCTVSYDLLNEREKRLYDKLVENAYTVNSVTDYRSFRFSGLFRCEQVISEEVIPEDEVRMTVHAVYDDHPELFWITESFDYMADEEEGRCAVILYSCYSPIDINQWLPKVKNAVNGFIQTVPKGLSEYERELRVHDHLINNCYYYESDANVLEFYHSVYGVLVKGKGVCEGYAKTFQLLLNLLGIECVCIVGEGVEIGEEPDFDDNLLHMWNAVRIDGEWYFADVTWDDSEHAAERHIYLNGNAAGGFCERHIPSKTAGELTEEELHKEGTYWALPFNLFVPECTADEYSYLIRDCARLDSYYDTGGLTDAMTAAAREKEDSFLIYIDPGFSSVEAAVDSLLIDYPQYIFDYIDTVNYRLSDQRIKSDGIRYYEDADMHFIILYFEYE